MAYEKTTWADGDIISAERMNNIENGIANLDENGGGVLIVNLVEVEEQEEEPIEDSGDQMLT